MRGGHGETTVWQLMPDTRKYLNEALSHIKNINERVMAMGILHIGGCLRWAKWDYTEAVEVYNLGIGKRRKDIRNSKYVEKYYIWLTKWQDYKWKFWRWII
jgi:hypothetical protein